MRTTTLVTVLFPLTLALTGCGPRNIKLPLAAKAPATSNIVTGVNNRTQVFDYEIPSVKKEGSKTRGVSVAMPFGGRIGNASFEQGRLFTVKRGANASLEVSCKTTQKSTNFGPRAFDKHTYACSGERFELLIDETQRNTFQGTAKVGDVALELLSTDQMAAGAPMRPSGFHVTRNGRWLASFEYYQQGKAYLGSDLSPEERDAVLTTLVSVHSTNHFFAHSIQQNQSMYQ